MPETYEALERGRADLRAENARLKALLADAAKELGKMLRMFGRPHQEEYVDGGASYKLACETVAAARAIRTAIAREIGEK